jgi:hypothetical protein
VFQRVKTERTFELIRRSGESAVTFLFFWNWSDKLLGFIYEIFVTPGLITLGSGKTLVNYAESFATDFDYVSLDAFKKISTNFLFK